MQLTLVAFYGDKPQPLRTLFAEVQQMVQGMLMLGFTPYRLPQIHATIIGLEGIASTESPETINANYQALRGESRVMKLGDVREIVEESPFLPMTVRVGGYNQDGYPFYSRGQHPKIRSFGVNDTSVVMMGWPIRNIEYPPTLDSLRRSFNAANILHKYHASPEDVDNDLSFVLGTIDRENVDASTIEALEARLRDFVASYPPVDLVIDHTDMYIVGYYDPMLPPQRSVRLPVDAPAKDLIELYRERE